MKIKNIEVKKGSNSIGGTRIQPIYFAPALKKHVPYNSPTLITVTDEFN